MNVHRDQRRNSQPKPFHQTSEFTLTPPRPRSSGDAGPPSRFDLLGLQVRGSCCPLQQRPCRGGTKPRVTPQTSVGGEGRLTLLGREEPVSRSRTGSRPEVMLGASCVCPHRDSVSEAAETPTTPCVQQQPGATKMSQLHLYLPSSLCDDEEQDTETEERRRAEDTNSAHHPLISQDETTPGPTAHLTASENIMEEEPEHS